ncbi:MAG: JAB domain-containing protein [Sphingobium sp.]|nr:JAB domain-containing protein [Sphingobium sp.]
MQMGIDPYLVARLSGHVEERLLFLFYDCDGAFRSEWGLTGSLSSVAVLRAELARAAVRSEARYAVMAHNHPSGAAGPSPQDIMSTRHVYRLFAALDVTLTDHVIVASDGLAFSFRLAGLV